MDYRSEKQLAEYINKYITPQQLKIKKIILNNQKNKEGQCKVYIELRRYDNLNPENSKRKRISTDIWVLPSNWSKKKEEVLKGDFEFQQKNRAINDLYSRIHNYINNPDIDYQFAQLKREEFLAIESVFPSKRLFSVKKSLLNYFEEYIEYRKRMQTPPNTLKEFVTVKNRLEAFQTHKNNKLFFEDMTFTFSEDFADYMLNEEKYTPGTVEKTFTVLITVLNHFYKKRKELGLEIPDTFTMKGFKKGKKSVNEANPLTSQQLKILREHTFEESHMNKTKDRFLWQCYTGLRYSDAFTITRKDVKSIKVIDKEGNESYVEYLWMYPSKTINHRVRIEQPLNDYALELLRKYEYDMTRLRIANQPYNRSLKTMFGILNEKHPDINPSYDVDFGSYASRDTFISKCVENGVNWHDILKYVGQSTFAITNRYVKTDNEGKKEKLDIIFK